MLRGSVARRDPRPDSLPLPRRSVRPPTNDRPMWVWRSTRKERAGFGVFPSPARGVETPRPSSRQTQACWYRSSRCLLRGGIRGPPGELVTLPTRSFPKGASPRESSRRVASPSVVRPCRDSLPADAEVSRVQPARICSRSSGVKPAAAAGFPPDSVLRRRPWCPWIGETAHTRCKHLFTYPEPPELGFPSLRIQTWRFPTGSDRRSRLDDVAPITFPTLSRRGDRLRYSQPSGRASGPAESRKDQGSRQPRIVRTSTTPRRGIYVARRARPRRPRRSWCRTSRRKGCRRPGGG